MIPDNHLNRMSPAEIVAFVATNTLATISSWSTMELVRIGWLGNPIIEILYSMTSAGVWIANRDTAGRDLSGALLATIDADTSTLSSYNPAIARRLCGALKGTIMGSTAFDSDTIAAKQIPQIIVTGFTSNAGGGLDADVAIGKTASAGYYQVGRMLALVSLDVGGAGTPTLVFSTTSSNAFRTFAAIPLTGDNVQFTDLDKIPIYSSDDNEQLKLDTTCSDLGNTKSYLIVMSVTEET